MSIIENIKEELLKVIEAEDKSLEMRKYYANSKDEQYQLICEEKFLDKLRKLVQSI